MSVEESLAHRLRRVYFPLYCLLGIVWGIRITGFSSADWPESAAVAIIPGRVIMALVVVVYVVLGIIAYRPREWRAPGEIDEANEGIRR